MLSATSATVQCAAAGAQAGMALRDHPANAQPRLGATAHLVWILARRLPEPGVAGQEQWSSFGEADREARQYGLGGSIETVGAITPHPPK
jgi:hypothetical protein